MDKRLAIRMLKYAKKTLTPRFNCYVCNRVEAYVWKTRGSRLSLKRTERTRDELIAWITRQLRASDEFYAPTFANYGRTKLRMDFTPEMWMQLRKQWIDLMIQEIESGRFDINNRYPVDEVINLENIKKLGLKSTI